MASSKLFTPFQIGPIHLKHRIVMAPLTRFRGDDAHVALPIVAEYYGQRASVPGTFMITEATFISARASGYPNVPGLWTPEQLASWKNVTDAVHSKGSFIFSQLWALGRQANPKILEKEGAGDLVSASAVPKEEGGPVPRALSEGEIWRFVEEYAQAAKNAVEVAGFDGVEIHGANGYLIDQFLQDVTNKRTDSWGGSIENRARFGLQVAKAVIKAVGKERVGIRMSPWSTFGNMRMKDPVPQFSYFIKELRKLGLAYIHLVEPRIKGDNDADGYEQQHSLQFALEAWDNSNPTLIAGGYNPDTAKAAIDKTYADYNVAIVFGRHFLANPDLPFRIMKGIELNKYDRSSFYLAKNPKGYIDYPFSKEWEEEPSRL